MLSQTVYEMPTVTNSLRWAIPVPVEVLGAHFNAYVELLPIITTLRLCHRYGPKANSGITRLSAELVAYIEAYLISDARSRHRAAWETDFNCFQMLCTPSEHVDDAELDPLYDQAIQRVYDDNSFVEEDEDEFDTEVWCRVEDMLCDDVDMWMGEHWKRTRAWEDRVGPKTIEVDRGFFTIHAKLFRQHFGLEVWICHVRLEDWPKDSHPQW